MDWGRGADGGEGGGKGFYVFGVSGLQKLSGVGFRNLRYMLRISFFVGVNTMYLFTF